VSDADNTVAERIRSFLIEDLQWQGERSELTDDLPLIQSRTLDSLGLMRLIGKIETEFGITIRDEEIVLANFGSIATIAAFVATKTNAA
jgi:methoxymalonate biosynthesis acyl carrier protein